MSRNHIWSYSGWSVFWLAFVALYMEYISQYTFQNIITLLLLFVGVRISIYSRSKDSMNDSYVMLGIIVIFAYFNFHHIKEKKETDSICNRIMDLKNIESYAFVAVHEGDTEFLKFIKDARNDFSNLDGDEALDKNTSEIMKTGVIFTAFDFNSTKYIEECSRKSRGTKWKEVQLNKIMIFCEDREAIYEDPYE